MAQLVSSWASNVESLPANYIMPPENRPGDIHTVCKEIPVIDLQEINSSLHRPDLASQIIKASQQLGIFQVINHGISEEMMKDAMNLYKEFFSMPVEDKSRLYCSEFCPNTQVYTSGLSYDKEEIHYWNDTLKHSCHPLEEKMPSWPDKPARYREVIGKYSVQVKKLGYKILDLLSEGLGLEEGSIREELRADHGMGINHYPRCPDPSLTMGISGHTDPNLLTLLQQEVYGLQILKDGRWVGVKPLPNAFVINLGYVMQVVSNGKIKGVVHRAVTNSRADRTSIVSFLAPLPHSVVEPAKELVTSSEPQLYKGFTYKDFLGHFVGFLTKKGHEGGTPLDAFEL